MTRRDLSRAGAVVLAVLAFPAPAFPHPASHPSDEGAAIAAAAAAAGPALVAAAASAPAAGTSAADAPESAPEPRPRGAEVRVPAAVVVDAESGALGAGWTLAAERAGAEGAGYAQWTHGGATAPAGALTCAVEVPRTGAYKLLLRCERGDAPAGPAASRGPDLRLRVDGGPWTELFVHGAPGWTWAARDAAAAAPSFTLAAGSHVVEIASAGGGLLVDRFALLEDLGAAGPDTFEAYADAVRAAQELVADPPFVPADGGTVLLDASALLPADAPAGARVVWDVPGALALSSDPTSPLAMATFPPGDSAEPVGVHVVDFDGNPLASGSMVLGTPGVDWIPSGIPVAWQPFDIAFPGPGASELGDAPNPFLDFRFNVTFTGPLGEQYVVPGFYDANGVGGSAGNVWKVRFVPDRGGLWHFAVSFRAGPDVAISLDPDAGAPSHFNGLEGNFRVMRPDPTAPGFLGTGRLGYVGEHYLRFADGRYFIKGGTDSPENFLAYRGFDGIHDMGNVGIIHEYGPHVADWQPGDPLWTSATTGYDSKGIIGALNYLSSVGVNSIYFLPMNLGGDGRDTCPFVAYDNTAFNKTHYDISRMRQWSMVFDHAQRKGILLHFVLAETESGNEQWLDGGALGVERKLYFRELVARFGAGAQAIKWNLCEEANYFTADDLAEQAEYLDALDPYDFPISYHSFTHNVQDYADVSGDPLFSASAVQYDLDEANDHVEWLRSMTAGAGHRWVVDMDENAPAGTGLTDGNADDLRKRALYDVYFSGGNIEWYAGYHALPLGGDVKMEDFRTREAMWNFMRHARLFMQQHMPFWEMEPADALLSGESTAHGGGQVFELPGRAWAIYLPDASPSGAIDLSGSIHAELELRWFDPRNGAFAGAMQPVEGGSTHALGAPPSAPDQDWVVWIRPPLDADPLFLLQGGYGEGLPGGPGTGVDLDDEDT